jgi:hypothetical protein
VKVLPSKAHQIAGVIGLCDNDPRFPEIFPCFFFEALEVCILDLINPPMMIIHGWNKVIWKGLI